MEVLYHTPVLVESVLRYLPAAPDGIYVDGTLGGGGHTEQLLEHLSPAAKVIGFDRDAEAIAFARLRLARFGERVLFVAEEAARLLPALRALGIDRIDGFLLDLGVSSHQIDDASRGFSFQGNGRIDMRMDRTQRLDGWTVVNEYGEERLAGILFQYGEERASRRIARILVEARAEHPIDTTEQLAWIVGKVTGARFLTKTLARVFQAIRIEVNDELGQLRTALASALKILRPGGRIVVISYHSLEDRIVKNFFREEASDTIPSLTKLAPDTRREPLLTILTKKPVEADEAERERNPRAGSAKLRAAERS